MTKQKMDNKPGIIWTLTRDEPEQAIEDIIDELKERYNLIMTDEKFEFAETYKIPPEMIGGEKVKIMVKKNGKHYGNVTIQYDRQTVDRSTNELKSAHRFFVFFNMSENSDDERDYFIKKDENG